MSRLSVAERRLIVATVLLAALFVVFPQIDLWIMGLLYDNKTGFPLYGDPLSLVYKDFREVFAYVLFGGLAIATIARAFGRPLLGLTWQRLGVVWGTLVIGLGVVGNLVFKEHFGRARPESVEQFGGMAHFTPAWIPSSACDSNCSFISGDAGLGFATLAFAIVAPPRWRKPALAAAIATGTAFGIMRLLTGSHFPSDVLFAGLLMALFAVSLNHRLVERDYRIPQALIERMRQAVLRLDPGRKFASEKRPASRRRHLDAKQGSTADTPP